MLTVTSEPTGTWTQHFDDTFREHAQFVYRTAYGVTGSHQDAEDVLQTIFLKLVGGVFPPDARNHPRAYLYRAAVNTSLNSIRARRREVLVDDDERFESTVAPAGISIDDELHKRLYEAIAQLKPEAAQIVILRYVHDQSDAEIARLLGMSRGSVALRLFRSRMRLKTLLRSRTGD
jgi:RNA polymerase sigma-70 factor (ECF subfamily)